MKSINLKTKKVKKREKQKAERPNGIKKQMKRKKDMVSASESFITDTTLCTICPYNVPPFDDWTQCSKCTSWYHFSCGPDDSNLCYYCESCICYLNIYVSDINLKKCLESEKNQNYQARKIRKIDLSEKRLTIDKFTIKTINSTTTAAEENQDQNPETPSSSSGVSINKEINKIDSDSEKIDFNDPATWPKQINIKLRDCLMENDRQQLIFKDFPKNVSGRKFSDNYYYRTLSNGEKFCRSYLLYSKTHNSVFRYFCKLMSDNTTQLTSGCNDWQHLSHILKVHETSVGHIENSSKYIELRMN
ncbi:zinc finger MYM-type protein 5-like [Hydra vulgaris]|uniref:Zinc finger MYM-type protein 5-like n=1 Tax=Hydra vulgaris TaxID=6087 RepID=A0ABM4BPW2_HYDVU